MDLFIFGVFKKLLLVKNFWLIINDLVEIESIDIAFIF